MIADGKRHTRDGSSPRLNAIPVRPSEPSSVSVSSVTTRPRRATTLVATRSTRGIASCTGTLTRVKRGTTMPWSLLGARTPDPVNALTSTIASSGNGLNSASQS